MKKIIDSSRTLVTDMLDGYAKAYSERVEVIDGNILVRKNRKDPGKIPVIIGNGSGHEPCMIDLVGYGLFDANVCGDVFTAPTPIDMMKAVRIVDNGNGVLILVSSHQGDILNAKMTVMMAKAEGIECKMVVLWDDISSAPKGMESERRGAAGLFFPFRIVTQAAETGLGLSELVHLAERVRDNVRSLSVAISPGTHPQTGMKTFDLPEDEIEIGMGVHGEKGSGRIKLCSAKILVSYLLDRLLDDGDFTSGDSVMVLLNNSGATTRMELLILYRDVFDYLEKRNIKIVRSFVGTYVTVQESAGFSLALLRSCEEFEEYYDSRVDSPLF